MKLSNYLETDLIFFDLKSNSLDKALTEMLSLIKKQDTLLKKSFRKIEQTFIEKKYMMPSLTSGRLFLPHISTEYYPDILVSIGFFKSPINLEGSKEELNVICLVISSDKHKKTMLSLIGALTCFSESNENINKLISISKKKSSSSIIDFIALKEKCFSNSIKAKDIANSVKPIDIDENIQSLASRFVCENIESLPVVDSKNNLIGEVRAWELIKMSMPAAVTSLNNVSFLRNLEFSDYLAGTSSLKVKDIIRKKAVSVDSDTSVMEIAFMMLKRKLSKIYVLEKKRYLGTISVEDIVRKALHF